VRRGSGYTPVFEDWLWHSILPCLAYAAITAAALCFHASPRGSSFAIAAAALGLLLIAIHNAWDTLTYIVLQTLDGSGEPPDDSPPA